ncbi:hypothetical protein AKJ16_DCAP08952 [Drosera capensis]
MSGEARSSKAKLSGGSNKGSPSKPKSETTRNTPSFSSTPVTKRKIESSMKQQQTPDSKNSIAPKTPVKSEGSARAASTSTKTSSSINKTRSKTVPTKRERKVYTLPGQRCDPPEERDPLRIFYSSLSEQIPSSEMAEFWLMDHGLLSPERAKRAYEKKQRRQKQNRLGTPIKSPPPPPRKPDTSIKQKQALKNGDVKAKKRIASDSEDEYIATPKRRRG